jgi:hypothetical protein
MYHNFRVVFNRLVLFFGLLLSPHSVLVFVAPTLHVAGSSGF